MAPKKRQSAATPIEEPEPELPKKERRRISRGPVQRLAIENLLEEADKSGTSTGSGQAHIKKEYPAPAADDIRRMTARLHYGRKTGSSTAYDDYHSKDPEGKRAWFYEVYKVDPRLESFSSVNSSRSFVKSDLQNSEIEWLTEEQIMSHNGYTNPDHAEYSEVKTALLAGLESRPHVKPEMAALNKKQYQYTSSKTVKSVGLKKEDTLLQGGSIEERAAEKISKTFDKFEAEDFTVLSGKVPVKEAQITLEPWKKEAMALEKSISFAQAKASKLVTQAQNGGIKLGLLACQGQVLSDAVRIDLDEKGLILVNAQEAFHKALWSVDQKSMEKAEKFKEKMVPALEIFRLHINSFEKVWKLANSHINTYS